ncbi:MAG: AAA family ATPase [Streptosporangiales bacterium]|nr:AAA family ATPase [Streptosporangiales bacterium]
MSDVPESPLIASLRRAVEASPEDLPLRLHLGELLLDSGDAPGAIEQAAAALQRDPGLAAARELMGRALGATGESSTGERPEQGPRFDWTKAEEELKEHLPPPPFVSEGRVAEPAAADAESGEPDIYVERSSVNLADVGGMTAVKERLEAAFLAPMRSPELRSLFGKSMRGGLLMYGPPGCGKTFLARAVAGELDAPFVSVSLADVLDMWIGNSEKNIKTIFDAARRNQPCVLFLDELDAIGLKRSKHVSSGMRGTVNQLLLELDSVESDNEGVFLLAASNQPWDIDSALLRPGRLDRTILVLPPDAPARAAIIRYYLRDRPIAGIDLDALVARTDGFTGADLAHLCESAAERVILEVSRTGNVRVIGMADFDAALDEVRPSAGPWFETARNVVEFANEGGRYDELRAYMKRRKLI